MKHKLATDDYFRGTAIRPYCNKLVESLLDTPQEGYSNIFEQLERNSTQILQPILLLRQSEWQTVCESVEKSYIKKSYFQSAVPSFIRTFKVDIQEGYPLPLISPKSLDNMVSVCLLKLAQPVLCRRRYSIDDAVVFLVFALGEFHQAVKSAEFPSSPLQTPTQPLSSAVGVQAEKTPEQPPGIGFSLTATAILSRNIDSYELRFAQAHILAAFYFAQLGYVRKGLHHVKFASRVIMDLVER